MGNGSSEKWFDASGVMKRGPFLVDDHGKGPLITRRGHLVNYVTDSGQSGAQPGISLGGGINCGV